MDETIYVMLMVLCDFALEVGFNRHRNLKNMYQRGIGKLDYL